jgi:hypothetical protein
MYQISNEYLLADRKKVRTTDNSGYFSKSKHHNLGKNELIETKRKLDLYLSMAKQSTKYQMNICSQREKKMSRKTDNSFKGHNSSKN